MLALVLSSTLATLTIVFWVGVWAGYHVGYAHRGLVGCRPHRWLLAAWRWYLAVTWRLLIGPQPSDSPFSPISPRAMQTGHGGEGGASGSGMKQTTPMTAPHEQIDTGPCQWVR